jgi:serine/threonine protein phosphatase 1
MTLRRQACEPAPRARTPPGTVVYAVGDIHGSVALLEELIAGVRDDARVRRARRRVLVFLGDYINRGEDSPGAIERALDPGLPGFDVVALKGNNEDAALRFLDGDLAVGAHWFDFGGTETLRQYGVAPDRLEPPDPALVEELRWKSDALADYGMKLAVSKRPPAATLVEDLRRRFARALPARHLGFLRTLAVAHREGDYYFVHAGIRPGIPVAAQSDMDRMWIRQRFLESDAEHGAVVVHGHSIARAPVVRRNRIGIDTGAYLSGVLSCLVLDGAERSFLQAGRRGRVLS